MKGPRYTFRWTELASGRSGLSAVRAESKTEFTAWLRRMNRRGGRVLSYHGI